MLHSTILALFSKFTYLFDGEQSDDDDSHDIGLNDEIGGLCVRVNP